MNLKVTYFTKLLDSYFVYIIIICIGIMILQIKNNIGEWIAVVYISCLLSLGFAIVAFFFNFYFAKVVGSYFVLPVMKSKAMELQ